MSYGWRRPLETQRSVEASLDYPAGSRVGHTEVKCPFCERTVVGTQVPPSPFWFVEDGSGCPHIFMLAASGKFGVGSFLFKGPPELLDRKRDPLARSMEEAQERADEQEEIALGHEPQELPEPNPYDGTYSED